MPSFPSIGRAAEVKHCEHHRRLDVAQEIEGVREPSEKRPSHIALDLRKLFRCLGNAAQEELDFSKKFCAEPRPL